jgi:glutathione S-transferase
MPLRIYGIARTRAFRALWMAHELGLEYEHLPIEIRGANPDLEAYLELNPNGRLPTIDDDGFILWESLAINLYLAKKHALGTLYPESLEDEAHTWKWCLWAANEVERGVNIWSLHAVRLPPAERNPAALADAAKVLQAPFRVLDAALAGRISSARISRLRISTSPPSCRARSTWISPQRRTLRPGSRVASNGRRRSKRVRCAMPPMRRRRRR